MTTKEKIMTTTIHAEAELHAFLDALVDGQTITATWVDGGYHTTVTGPVEIRAPRVDCTFVIRYGREGGISHFLTSVEATVEQTATVTRDDPDALLALIESLAEGQKVSAEWRSEDGERTVTVTGPVERDSAYECVSVLDVWGEDYGLSMLGGLHPQLHSVTATIARTVRWEREA